MTHLLMRLSSPKNDKFKITKIKFQKAFYGDFQTLWSGPGYISEVVYIVHTHLHWLPINCALCFSLLKKQDWNLQSPNKTRPLSQKSDDFDKYRTIKLDKVLLNWKKFTKMYKWQNKKTYKQERDAMLARQKKLPRQLVLCVFLFLSIWKEVELLSFRTSLNSEYILTVLIFVDFFTDFCFFFISETF